MTSIQNLTLQPNTVACQIVHRYTGATKNAQLTVIYTLYKKRLNELVRILSKYPPGESAGPIVPPEQPTPPEPIAGASPTLVEWPEPNRPFSAGTLLEAKHDFETALPAGWTTVTSGNGSLSRVVGTSLTGNGYMRSVKSVAGP